MPAYLCVTCGSQFAPTPQPPPCCPVCDDERQYVPPGGQQWTTLDELRNGHRNALRPQEPGLTGIGTEPAFAIGQRALLVQAPGGNVLWECVSLIDDATVAAVKALGGLSAIAISHPHYYSSMVEWSRAFGGAPVYLHAADRRWVMRPDPAIVFWDGEARRLGEGLMLLRCGGHFEGGTVLHWAAGAGGRGALLSGDILQVCADRRHVSFMYSYPNYIPLPAAAVERAVRAVEPYSYDRIYGAWWDKVIADGARAAVARSAARYLRAIGQGRHPLAGGPDGPSG
jgi:glyoxylase-like metal-dependent hydrolase (beta-lactamase superfamily II)